MAEHEPQRPVRPPEGIGRVEEKLSALSVREREQARERLQESLHAPRIIGSLHHNVPLKEPAERTALLSDIHTVFNIPDGTSLPEFFHAGKKADERGHTIWSRTVKAMDDTYPLQIRGEWSDPSSDYPVGVLVLTLTEQAWGATVQPRLIVRFGKDSVLGMEQWNDPFNAWGQIAAREKWNGFFLLRPAPADVRRYYRARKESERRHPEPLAIFEPSPKELKELVYVPAGEATVAPLEKPLGTEYLWLCAGLIVVDPSGKRHMLAHVNGGEYADKEALEKVEKALEGFHLLECQISIVIGDQSEGIPRELTALLREKYGVAPERIRIVAPRHPARFHSPGEDAVSVAREGRPALFRAFPYGAGEEESPVRAALDAQHKKRFRQREK